jgi:hypothetical protein
MPGGKIRSSRSPLRVVRRDEDFPDVSIEATAVEDVSPEAEEALIDALATAVAERYLRLEGQPE